MLSRLSQSRQSLLLLQLLELHALLKILASGLLAGASLSQALSCTCVSLLRTEGRASPSRLVLNISSLKLLLRLQPLTLQLLPLRLALTEPSIPTLLVFTDILTLSPADRAAHGGLLTSRPPASVAAHLFGPFDMISNFFFFLT